MPCDAYSRPKFPGSTHRTGHASLRKQFFAHSKMWFIELVVCMTIKRSLRMVCANYGEQPIPFNHVKSEIFAWFHQKHTCVNQSFCQSGLYVPETVKTRILLFRWDYLSLLCHSFSPVLRVPEFLECSLLMQLLIYTEPFPSCRDDQMGF